MEKVEMMVKLWKWNEAILKNMRSASFFIVFLWTYAAAAQQPLPGNFFISILLQTLAGILLSSRFFLIPINNMPNIRT